METIKKICSHLELLGYDLTSLDVGEDSPRCFVATHSYLGPLIVSERLPNIIAVFIQLKYYKPISIDMLKYINKINDQLLISSVFCEEISGNETRVLIRSFYIGEYSEDVFGQFFMLLRGDMGIFIGLDNFEEIFVK